MILITGGSGFIASHVIEKLAGKEKIRAMDLVERKGGFSGKEVEFVKGDVRKLEDVEKAVSGCSGIIHLAAQIDVSKSVEDPLFDFEENALGTLHMLIAAKKAGVKRFVFSSSAAVYGHPEKVPVSEDMEPAPVSPYGISKLAAERYVENYARVHGLSAIAMRFFNVYGPGQGNNQYAGVITKFGERISSGKAPLIFGDGGYIRDYVHVSDVADAVVKAYYSEVKGEAVNIGSGKGTSVIELAEIMVKLSGKDFKPEFKQPREGDIRESIADVKKAKKLLGWEAKVKLKEGLKGL